jgi:hypothetical protein
VVTMPSLTVALVLLVGIQIWFGVVGLGMVMPPFGGRCCVGAAFVAERRRLTAIADAADGWA